MSQRDNEAGGWSEADQALWIRTTSGDEIAFGQLVNRYVKSFETAARSVFLTERSVPYDSDDIEDVVSKTIAKVWAKKGSFGRRNDAKPSTWMFAVARNTALDDLKALRRRRRRETEAYQHQTGRMVGSAGMERNDAVWDCLALLSKGERELLMLFYMDDYSVLEIADLLGVQKTTVTTRLSRARDAYRAAKEG